MKIKTLMMVTALAFGMIACSDDETANNNARLSLEFNTVTTANSTAQRALTNGLVFTEGTISVSELRFDVETDVDSLEIDFNLEQVAVIDFATGIASPDINAITIPAGTYSAVSVELDLFDEGSTPAIALTGTFTHNGEEIPVLFEFNSAEVFEVEKEGVISFGDSQSAVAQITFDPNAWFAAVTTDQLALAVRNENGFIVINKDVNTDIFEVVEDGIDIATDIEIEF